MKKWIGSAVVLAVVGMSALAWSSRGGDAVSMEELNAATAARINEHVQMLVRQHAMVTSLTPSAKARIASR